MRNDLLRRRRVPLVGALALAGVLAVGAGCEPAGPGPSASTTVPFIPATTIVGTPSFPNPLVAVGDDGAVVTVGQSGARGRTLVPTGAGVVNSISLSADKATAFFDRVTPAGVTIYSVPTNGTGAAQSVALGAWPAASPTGTKLAYLTTTHVVVRDLVGGQQASWSLPGRAASLAWAGTKLVWVQDSTTLVVLDTATAGAQPQVVAASKVKPGEKLYAVVGGPGPQLASAAIGFGYDDTSTGRLDLAADLTVTRTEPTENAGYRDRASYSGGHWFLRVDGLHNLRWSVGGGAGLIAEDYLAADW
jgi:hypothetical protein